MRFAVPFAYAILACVSGCGGPDHPPLAYATEVPITKPPDYYVAQAMVYFDTLDTRADPDIIPNYAPDVARWEWPPWLKLTGFRSQNVIDTTRSALILDPSTVEERDCRFFATQPFARCRVNFHYAGGTCPIYEEFSFDAEGRITFMEAWSIQPGLLPSADPTDLFAEDPSAHRLSTKVPGLGDGSGTIALESEAMLWASERDAEVADFALRASDFWYYWFQELGASGGDTYARGCGW